MAQLQKFVERSGAEWNALIQKLPDAHILQTWEWGMVKADYGWTPSHYIWEDDEGGVCAAALVLARSVNLGGRWEHLKVLYVPKGPLLDWNNQVLAREVLDDLQKLAKQTSAIFIKIDPDVAVGWGEPGTAEAYDDLVGKTLLGELNTRGWHFSQEQIQFRNTVLIDLKQGEENLLAGMKQKTRYNVRLASKKGVNVRVGGVDAIAMLNEMYAKTAVRDGFVIRAPDYYELLWKIFITAGLAEPLIAELEGKPIAAVFIFTFAGVSRYLYGMSVDEHREVMPNYLLQWEAIRRSIALGSHTYDMWGAPEVFNESDSLWGVYRFKEGFNGKVLRTVGAWDYANKPMIYKLYTQILPRILDVMRRKEKNAIRKRVMQ